MIYVIDSEIRAVYPSPPNPLSQKFGMRLMEVQRGNIRISGRGGARTSLGSVGIRSVGIHSVGIHSEADIFYAVCLQYRF